MEQSLYSSYFGVFLLVWLQQSFSLHQVSLPRSLCQKQKQVTINRWNIQVTTGNKWRFVEISYPGSATRKCCRRAESAHRLSNANFGWLLPPSAETNQNSAGGTGSETDTSFHSRDIRFLSLIKYLRFKRGGKLTLFPEKPINSNNRKTFWGRRDSIWNKKSNSKIH